MNLNEDIRFADFELSFIAVWRKKLIPLAVGVLFFIFGIILTFSKSVENVFRASASVYAVQTDSHMDNNSKTIAMSDYTELAKSIRVCERAAQMIPSYGLSAEDIQNIVYVSTSGTGLIMNFAASSSDAALAVDLANAVAESFVIEMRSATGRNVVQMLDSPDSAQMTSNGFRDLWKIRIVFFIVGVFLTSVVIFVKELFSDRVRLIEQCVMEDEDVILGILPEIREKK